MYEFVIYFAQCKLVINHPTCFSILASESIPGTKFNLLYSHFGLFKSQIFVTEFQWNKEEWWNCDLRLGSLTCHHHSFILSFLIHFLNHCVLLFVFAGVDKVDVQ